MSWGGVSSGTLLGCENPPGPVWAQPGQRLALCSASLPFFPHIFFFATGPVWYLGSAARWGQCGLGRQGSGKAGSPVPPPLAGKPGGGARHLQHHQSVSVSHTPAGQTDRSHYGMILAPPPLQQAGQTAWQSRIQLCCHIFVPESRFVRPPRQDHRLHVAQPVICYPGRLALIFAAASLVCCSPPSPSRLAVRAGYHSARFFGMFVPRAGDPLPRQSQAGRRLTRRSVPTSCFSASAAI